MDKTNRILFKQPDLKRLIDEFTVVDMHMHTKHSDGINSAKQIAAKAKEMGIGVAITDHNEIKGAVEIEKYNDLLTIPGIEATSREGTHLLVYFYEIEQLKEFFKDHVKPFMGNDLMSPLSLEMEELIKRARKFKTVIIAPHPYAVTYTGICNAHFSDDRLCQVLDKIDGVEVINSENVKKWNLKSAVLGFNLDKCITGGSDGHTLFHLGKVVSYAKCENTRKAFLDAVKKKQNKVIGKEIDILRKVTVNSFKLKTTLKNYPDVIEKNLHYNLTFLNSKRRKLTAKMKKLRYQMGFNNSSNNSSNNNNQ